MSSAVLLFLDEKRVGLRLSFAEIDRRMATRGLHPGRHGVFRWFRGETSPSLRALAVLFDVLGLTAEERVHVLTLAAQDAIAGEDAPALVAC